MLIPENHALGSNLHFADPFLTMPSHPAHKLRSSHAALVRSATVSSRSPPRQTRRLPSSCSTSATSPVARFSVESAKPQSAADADKAKARKTRSKAKAKDSTRAPRRALPTRARRVLPRRTLPSRPV